MYDTIDEITQAIKTSEGILTDLRSRMEDDYDLWSLVPYEAEDANGKVRKGYQSYTSSAPRNFFDKVLDGLSKAQLTIRIQLPEKATEAEKRAANIGELYLFGALNAIDRQLSKRGEPPLRESLSFFICLRGWYAMRALVYMPKGGKETTFDVQAWDPIQVTWELGRNGLLWAARKHTATQGQILAEYGLTITGKDAEVTDFWDEERNSVLIESTFAKPPTAHKIGHVPVLIGAVGSMPTLQSSTGTSVLEERGDSVYAAARALYKPFNKYISTLMDMHQRGVTGSIVHMTKDGKKTFDGDPYLNWQEIVITEGESISALELPPSPPETAAILATISQDLQQSTLPFPLAYGGTEQAMSGRALSVLTEATRSVYFPRAEALTRSYTWLSEELLVQFSQKGIRKAELRGYKGKENKEFFQVEVKPSEIKTSWYVVAEVEPKLPRDEQGEIMMALAASQVREPGGLPLLSDQTIYEDILKLKDPLAEDTKRKAQLGERLPPVFAAEVAKALKAQGKDDLAAEVMVLLGAKPQGGPSLPPQLVEAIIRALVESGQPQLARALLDALGAGGQTGAPPVAGTEVAPPSPGAMGGPMMPPLGGGMGQPPMPPPGMTGGPMPPAPGMGV